MGALKDTTFISDFVGIHIKKDFPIRFGAILEKYFKKKFSVKQIKKAVKSAFSEYDLHMASIRAKADEYIEIAKEKKLPVIILAGRPYHIDAEVNHGIDKLICEMGAVLLTEDSVSYREDKFKTGVLNQWTYHSRLYAAAKFAADYSQEKINMNLVQLVSFGCGVDAVTTDETRDIIEKAGKIYTQIKIDEVTNTGAAKIRLRSLFEVAGITGNSKEQEVCADSTVDSRLSVEVFDDVS